MAYFLILDPVKMSNKLTRRVFLGWLTSIFGSLASITLFDAFYGKYSTFGTKVIRKLRNKKTHTHHPSRDARRAFRKIPVWENKKLILNTKNNLIHWPNAILYKTRYQIDKENKKEFEISDWKKLLDDNNRFANLRTEIIFENLALIEIKPKDQDQLEFVNLENAINIIKDALDNKMGDADGERLLVLYSRLLSLLYEDDASKAFQEISLYWKNKKKRKWKHDWLTDTQKFSIWHGKTIERKYGNFRKRLSERIANAKRLKNDASSSGKDTI